MDVYLRNEETIVQKKIQLKLEQIYDQLIKEFEKIKEERAKFEKEKEILQIQLDYYKKICYALEEDNDSLRKELQEIRRSFTAK